MRSAQDYSINQLAALSDLYQLLAFFLILPTREFAAALTTGTLQDDLEQILEELEVADESSAIPLQLLGIYRSEKADEEELLKELRVDYTQLFSHPSNPTVHIYESLLRHNPLSKQPKPLLFTNAIAMDCEDFYKRAGLQRSGAVNESGDHLATQLQFLSFLFGAAYTKMQDSGTGVSEGGVETVNGRIKPQDPFKLIDEFMEAHVSLWALQFFERVQEASQTQAYRAFGVTGQLTQERLL